MTEKKKINFDRNIYRNALTYNPTDPIKDANGNWTESPSKTEYFNPLALLWETEGENLSTNLRMFASATFTPIEGLDVKYLVSSDVLNQTRGYYESQKHISTIRDNKNGYADKRTIRRANELSELTAQYSKVISDHSIF